ncbi:iron chaperone [Spirosoma utsteinense]|uniref:YdhG-like domain-containing protein n=1 Tax=Spirosoma utsteinense TaxID=2585773 RepID=A0ABR6WDU0_9BACT|nr:DUF1801 domain-containing protein [Spirosoma utsteinense]MBC3788209.1 putative protein YdhG (YjbR/CyaY superfamily) [Spirosoma utsteinense]MBC3794170.1 putative protein YdhG (YjbR/CyaY superfamily) [Spirosoma utsteinense]
MDTHFTDIDSYIDSFPVPAQDKLKELRQFLRDLVPAAEETIKYAIPTLVWEGNLVHYAAFRQHIGFYSLPTSIKSFAEELTPYKTGKGSIRFALDKPLPLDLIRKLVLFRVEENRQRSATKNKVNAS